MATMNIVKLIENIESLDILIQRYENEKKKCEAELLAKLSIPQGLGQYTHHISDHIVTIKKPIYYKVNTDIYLDLKKFLNKKFNPIIEKLSYNVGVKTLKDAYLYAETAHIKLLRKFIIEQPGQSSVSIKREED